MAGQPVDDPWEVDPPVETPNDMDEVVRRFVDALTGSGDGELRDRWSDRLSRILRRTDFRTGDTVIEHHAVAEALHFLVEGSLRYEHLVTGGGHTETISSDRQRWMPVGWTAIHLRRYRVTAIAETDV
ncbi:MAG: hypothetical protein R3324_09595, partial [Halobacteriales archaeon]|nr:hypothetical protein [Halobacteriales archaeon]